MKDEILLGDTVKCKYTEVKGIAVSRTEFINGCIQFSVAQKHTVKNPISLENIEIGIDAQSLVIIKKGERHDKEEEEIEEESTGGRMRIMKRRGY